MKYIISIMYLKEDILMSNLSKEKREKQKVHDKLRNHDRDINEIKNNVQQLQKQYNDMNLRNILDDLDKETFQGSGRPLYTYENIADRNNTSASTVARIAEEHGKNRRSKKNA